MKKIIAWALATVLMLSGSLAVLAEDIAGSDGMSGLTTIESYPQVEDNIGVQEGTEVVIGTTTAVSGFLATDMWGTNTTDMDVRSLLQGYSVVAVTRTRGLAIDGSAVSSVTTESVEEGRTYVITIREGLVYNDGTPITAKDYVFSMLLAGAPEISHLGGTPRGMSHIIGFDEYKSGESDTLSGVRLLSDYTFSLTISGYFIPYFYGLAMLNVTPYPMHVIAPGCDIVDDGNGTKVGAGESAAEMDAEALGFTPGEFSAEMLQKTMLDPETGYVFYPYVTSGPYSLESYDPVTKEVSFIINTNYQGNYEGQKPHIERLVMRYVTDDTMLEMFENGEVDILNKVMDAEVIMTGAELVSAEDSVIRSTSYPRTGFAFIAFACEEGVTASVSVRKAIAASVDKLSLVSQSVGRFGIPVNAYYGLGQWMVGQVMAEDTEKGLEAVNVPEAMERWDIAYDLEAAKDLLASDGWRYDAQGEEFKEGDGAIRYRKNEDDELEPLMIKWALTEDSPVAAVLQEMLTKDFAELGIGLEVTALAFEDLLSHYYRVEERTYDMFFLSSNFSYLFDPYYDYNIADEYQGLVNTSGLRDEELMELARAMRDTPPAEIQQYLIHWVAFQDRWVELMPMVPLYSNTYYDFYRSDIQDYNIAQYPGWAYAIPYAWIGEADESEQPISVNETGVDGIIRVIDQEENE